MAQFVLTSTPDISFNSSSIHPEYGMSVQFAALNSISTLSPISPENCSATHRYSSTGTWVPVSRRASVSN